MKKFLIMMLIASVGLGLAACQKKPAVKDSSTQSTPVPVDSGSTNGGDSAQTGAATAFDANGAAALSAALAGKIIYFDYDKVLIKPEYTGIVSLVAHNLTTHTNWRIRLEGNTDQRGTREYNIGLGERRAQAVRRALMLQGVSESQLTTVSYGEERPAVEGDDESAFAKNRRVELAPNP